MQKQKDIFSHSFDREAERRVVDSWLALADSVLQHSKLTVRGGSRRFDQAKLRLVSAWRKPSTLGPWLRMGVLR